MTDRITLTQPVYMKVQGQWMIVLGGSQIDVADSTPYKTVATNIQQGTGTLLNGTHNNPVANFRAR